MQLFISATTKLSVDGSYLLQYHKFGTYALNLIQSTSFQDVALQVKLKVPNSVKSFDVTFSWISSFVYHVNCDLANWCTVHSIAVPSTS